ncbi:class I SAM-dependent methyltransferase [Nocardioides marmorisolisilvae]|uniref:Methyltransferase domain-containing protein n=1 Tax=Nocardioides marmorisolisilvae TaxID=1542737 RepID=A0A3N0DTN3_9ACTN|nr:methyltransferase domain-containing protein [Nocardioides marmorisolisilvae]RNL78972.1 methyltransferase domain-containing protein [Nocardioides marmorisolisilvae]
MVSEHDELAGYFNQWYADMAGETNADAIQQRHLGLPPELLSTSLLTWDGIGTVAELLALEPGQALVDLACGRGGYGLELAGRSGAELIGIDFAPAALDAARALAAARGQSAEFRVGDLVATGLQDGSADAVVVVDAIQFPADPAAAYQEIARILRPGGRVVLTCWEARDRGDEAVPERIRNVDLDGGLSGAGLREVRVVERSDWREVERGLWAEAAALDPGGDPALTSFHDEGVRSMETFEKFRRVLGSAVR